MSAEEERRGRLLAPAEGGGGPPEELPEELHGRVPATVAVALVREVLTGSAAAAGALERGEVARVARAVVLALMSGASRAQCIGASRALMSALPARVGGNHGPASSQTLGAGARDSADATLIRRAGTCPSPTPRCCPGHPSGGDPTAEPVSRLSGAHGELARAAAASVVALESAVCAEGAVGAVCASVGAVSALEGAVSAVDVVGAMGAVMPLVASLPPTILWRSEGLPAAGARRWGGGRPCATQ